jgi:hypothetical protein
MWTAIRYTSVKIDKAGQILIDEDGLQAETHEEREKALRKGHFPPAPADTEPYEAAVGGQAFQRIEASLIGTLLSQAANSSATGDDRISAGILKVFWEWDRERLVQLARACIRLGPTPTSGKQQKEWSSGSSENQITPGSVPTG